MNDAVDLTANQFQQNISIKLTDDYLSTLLAGNVMKFSVDLTKIFNSVGCIEVVHHFAVTYRRFIARHFAAKLSWCL